MTTADPAAVRIAEPSQARGVRRLVAFATGSGIGLVVDLGGFWLGVHLGIAPGIANVASSLTSVVVVYLLVTRRAFGARPSVGTFVAFLGWYALNIGVTSTLIEFGVRATDVPAFVLKVLSVPLSFSANFAFNIVLHRVSAALSASRLGNR